MRIRAINEKQFARLVGLSYGYVKSLRRKGQITCVRLGRAVRYAYPEHVELFLKQREQQANQ